MTSETILEFKSVEKSYGTAPDLVPVIKKLSFVLNRGTTLSVLGPSGSGKSTLLSLAAGIEALSAGEITLAGKELSELSEEQRAAARLESSGFIFQSFELVPSLTALENVMVPAELKNDRDAEAKARSLLKRVGLQERVKHLPSQLSGGERQRVAIARAFINEPEILFADEPTGNLDRASAAKVADLLFALNKEKGATLVIATHSSSLAQRCELVLEFESSGDPRLRKQDPVSSS